MRIFLKKVIFEGFLRKRLNLIVFEKIDIFFFVKLGKLSIEIL